MQNMFKKRGQGLSITVIVASVIGLIIIVVVIALLTGKLGGFSKGVESAVSCKNACIAIGHDFSGVETLALTKSGCNSLASPTIKTTILPGKFGDIPEGKVCCCYS